MACRSVCSRDHKSLSDTITHAQTTLSRKANSRPPQLCKQCCRWIAKSSRIESTPSTHSVASSMNTTRVGAMYDVFKISNDAPYDIVRMKILYPTKSEMGENNLYEAIDGDPFPVVIFASGGGVEANRYQWLGERLVRENGIAFVIYELLTSVFGYILPLSAVPNEKNITASVPPLKSIEKKLSEINVEGLLAGRLDLQNMVVGGHSMGGSAMLLYGHETQINSVKGIFAYGSSTAVRISSGSPPGSFLPIKSTAPVLIIGGSVDTCAGDSGSLFGVEWESCITPSMRTFHEAIQSGQRGYFVELDGANHMFIVDPLDATWYSMFPDSDTQRPVEVLQDTFSQLVSLFIKQCIHEDVSSWEEFEQFSQNQQPIISNFETKA